MTGFKALDQLGDVGDENFADEGLPVNLESVHSPLSDVKGIESATEGNESEIDGVELDEKALDAIEKGDLGPLSLGSKDHASSAFSLYLRDLRNTRLLTREDEQDIGREMEFFSKELIKLNKKLKNVQKKIKKKDLHDREKFLLEERRIKSAIKQNEHDLHSKKNELIRANLRLVVSIAKKQTSVNLEDAIMAGNIGLMTAVEKYNYALGHKFSSYATWWIKQAIMISKINTGNTVKIPAYMHLLISKMYRAAKLLRKRMERFATPAEIAVEMRNRVNNLEQVNAKLLSEKGRKPKRSEINKELVLFEANKYKAFADKISSQIHTELGRNPTPDELKEAIKDAFTKEIECEAARDHSCDDILSGSKSPIINAARVHYIQAISRLISPDSLDAPIHADGDVMLIDSIVDPNTKSLLVPDVKRISDQLKEKLKAALGDLKPIEAEILRLRFGLDDSNVLTLKDIGKKYHLTRERIRQLQERALLKIRAILTRYGLSFDDLSGGN